MTTAESHTTITGEVLTYPRPGREVAAFLARVRNASEDPRVSEGELVELIYGSENPILDQTMFSGRGAVTPQVFENPLYRVMTDLLDRKRVQAGTLSVARAEERHTMSVAEAAREIGVSTGAVRQAIAAQRLAAWKREGRWMLDPLAVRTYRDHVSRRGPDPSPALEARIGNVEGASMRLKAIDKREVGRAGKRVVDVEVPSFARAAVTYSGKERSCRTLILEPAARTQELTFGPFHVRGRFKVVDEVDRPSEASERFKAFDPK